MASQLTALKLEAFAGEANLPSSKDLQAENERLKAHLKRLRLYVSELEHAADTDPLIPVYNRRAFMRELSRAQSVADRYDIESSIVFFDLNDFKSINDVYGHAIGDEMLRQVGQVLMTGVRECDMVARLGGDEFGVLLFKTSPEIANAKATALAARIAEIHMKMPTGDVRISSSWGVSACHASETAEQILARADHNMYAAKGRSARASAGT